ISVIGEVGPCVFTSFTLSQDNGQSEPKPLHHMFQNRLQPCLPLSFGNIAHESLTRIWNKKDYQQFRNLHDLCILQHDTDIRLLPRSCRSCHKRQV
ncbi:MAG: SPASM domain-containing protein, partial [Desulfobacula sp.]